MVIASHGLQDKCLEQMTGEWFTSAREGSVSWLHVADHQLYIDFKLIAEIVEFQFVLNVVGIQASLPLQRSL